jgi:hypothetical protein
MECVVNVITMYSMLTETREREKQTQMIDSYFNVEIESIVHVVYFSFLFSVKRNKTKKVLEKKREDNIFSLMLIDSSAEQVCTHRKKRNNRTIITRLNSIVMIPPACLFRIVRCCAYVPIVVWRTTLNNYVIE